MKLRDGLLTLTWRLMKLSEFLKLIKKHGAEFDHHGKGHDVWRLGDNEVRVPRHSKEIPTGTVKSMLKDLGIKK